MSSGHARQRSNSAKGSSIRSDVKFQIPTPSITPQNDEFAFQPCAATGSFLLYAQHNVIYCLHHDTLAIERRFERHREDVSWISTDNVSERGAGRLVLSYDTGSTAIVWDLLTGDEVARFASYEQIRVATWMRNGNVAFGNAQGNIILFEPSTSEHLSARTIFDPITALAPASDCRTFAIGYHNGSILIATLQPSFTILHTLTTPRIPSPIAELAWHGSSSKQKSEMLAAQASDGDLRVWSVPKSSHGGDAPCVIRVLNKSDQREPGPCWFSWSKNGRIVQYTEGQTCAWDVRTKRVTYETVPTIQDVAAICSYGATATLFTLGHNYSVQQYDLNPSGQPIMVANVQHAPANTPPSPPVSLDEQRQLPLQLEEEPMLLASEASEDEDAVMSPLQKIANELVELEDERRDRVGPLSPVSSRASQSSRSSGGSGRQPRYRYDRPTWGTARSSRSTASGVSGASGTSGTVFSSGESSYAAGASQASVSIRSGTSAGASRYGSSALRKEVTRSPDESKKTQKMDLFPFTKARLADVPFRPAELGPERTSNDLRKNLLKVVFGWENDIDELIRDELARHPTGSAAAVLLSKWLGDLGADFMASMVGSESMTSSDWMLLALSNMGQGSQKKVGEAFVQRLLEKGDIHPAVAILLGLGEQNDAIEVYVSQKHYMEAVLLTCLIFPTDWQRQSFLVRKWGEAAVAKGKAELAVRCFSCMGLETTEPWFSPRAQDAVFSAQKQALLGSQLSPPLSPPSVGSSRVAARMASLKLVTDFSRGPQPRQIVRGENDARTPMIAGTTPIAESATTPAVGNHGWIGRSSTRDRSLEPSSARTATPGAYGSRKRIPSRSDAGRSTTTNGSLASLAIPDRGQREPSKPRTAIDNIGREAETLPFSTRRATSAGNAGDLMLSAAMFAPTKTDDHLPSPAVGVFDAFKERKTVSRTSSRSRNQRDLHLAMDTTVVEAGPDTHYTNNLSPPLTDASLKSAKARSIDEFISSLDEANHFARGTDPRPEERPASRTARTRSRTREESQGRGRSDVRYIRPAKRSPSSPVPMSHEGASTTSRKEASTNTEAFDDERYYRELTSPVATESVTSTRRARSRARYGTSKTRTSSRTAQRTESPEAAVRTHSRGASRASSRRPTADRGRSGMRGDRSPESPQSMRAEDFGGSSTDTSSARPRQRSTSRVPRDRSISRRPTPAVRGPSLTRNQARAGSPDSISSSLHGAPRSRPLTRTRKELAAKELEARRLSLARRPSAPSIPHPEELRFRPLSGGRSNTDDLLGSIAMYHDPIQRSQTADPINKPVNRFLAKGTSTPSVPIGLPANPRAMRHPRYMSAEPEAEDIPDVPAIPQGIYAQPPQEEREDDIGPLLPATTFLPSTTFGQPANLPRSASAPPQEILLPNAFHDVGRRPSLNGPRGHTRMNSPPEILPPSNYKRISPPPFRNSIDGANETQVIIIEEEDAAPPVLSQLQHLGAPPPPPPPPPPPFVIGTSSTPSNISIVNVGIDEEPQRVSPTNATATGSPHAHRRGRGSVSENLGSTFRRVTDRMRSTSRSGHRSPPALRADGVAPYESVPDYSYPRNTNTRSPGEGNNIDSYFNNMPYPPPPPPVQPWEQIIPPREEQSYYKHPKEIRANMPPETLQAGVYKSSAYKPEATPMI
ncbi:uncharacterized protein M421DRAFT_99495 [Didymella exigua CBS 183.55]|uniref:Gem-associated protein 5 TPR domain-containing protein n=1 Tax=Didymella exigua CBS 183.55 TaxID=1150837 RepID=A0A6A5RU86_9PLEO|nr:uncharacterized protein M421DRAFT_99495 [Didymella exigua CBS 183.55]KAF1930930.1 hypothetical protein M421DRAFT_99495 [Didymella exigua CBS 183.55]